MPISKKKKLVIFGIEDFARIAYEYYTHDSDYEVVGFTVDKQYLTLSELCGLPVVAFDDIENTFPPESHEIYCAITYQKMNRTRALACRRAESKRYTLASYISSKAFVWHNAVIGKHAFIFEGNIIQPGVAIGNSVVLWSSNHVGHDSKIHDNVFISSHVVISGWCDIGANTFIGVNATLANNTRIGKESWVMHGSILSGTIPDNFMVRSAPSQVSSLNEDSLNQALERASKNRST